jgi:hypothetical protein
MKSWIAVSIIALASLSAAAEEAAGVAAEGKMLLTSNGARLGAVYRVTSDGSAQVVVDGKMVTVPASTLSLVEGKLMTSLSKSDIRKLR